VIVTSFNNLKLNGEEIKERKGKERKEIEPSPGDRIGISQLECPRETSGNASIQPGYVKLVIGPH
jgi:hypothetical protein